MVDGALGQFGKPETAVQHRQAALFLMGNHKQRIKAERDFSRPNPEVVRASASLIDVLKTVPSEALLKARSM